MGFPMSEVGIAITDGKKYWRNSGLVAPHPALPRHAALVKRAKLSSKYSYPEKIIAGSIHHNSARFCVDRPCDLGLFSMIIIGSRDIEPADR